MNEHPHQFVLSSRGHDAPAPVLVDVQAEGRLDGVLFELALRQTYRNDSDRVLEVVYTFPLPPMAVLLGFASELNGQRHDGTVVAKPMAERQYEDALAEGDTPVMLEAHADGLHTANIGNLKPGDELVLECRYAQLLGFEQGRIRVSIPSTIAPRYGDAEQAGLQPQQVPQISIDASYPLAMRLTIGEALSSARVACPTHRFETYRDDQGLTRWVLAGDARLDRDVVIVLTPPEAQPSLLVRAADTADATAPVVLMAAMQPPIEASSRPIGIKLLVDCSGSMAGDSIASARAALLGVAAGLKEGDRVSLSRFGSVVDHMLEPLVAGPAALRRLVQLIEGIQADLGGTEVETALCAVFDLGRGARQIGTDVLLITDGHVWQTAKIVAAARESGHRVFAIGVGSSPTEAFLRALAESTGGACEFATPGETLEAAARRMLYRMRLPNYTKVRIDWGCNPAWSSDAPRAAFGGDTVIAFAGLSGGVEASAVRLLADDQQGQTLELAISTVQAHCPGDSLARVAAARRLAHGPADVALALALRYQLMSPQTSYFLAHIRAASEKVTDPGALHRVSSMVAAGWGGFGTVSAPQMELTAESTEMIRKRQAVLPAMERISAQYDRMESPAFLRRQAVDRGPATLADIANFIVRHFTRGAAVEDLALCCETLTLHDDATRAIDAAVALGISPAHVWLLLALWINNRTDGLANATLNARLQPLVSNVEPSLAAAAVKVFRRHLGDYPIDSWEFSRRNRIARALKGLDMRAR